MEELGLKPVDSEVEVAAAAAAGVESAQMNVESTKVEERDLYDEVKRLEAVLRSIAMRRCAV